MRRAVIVGRAAGALQEYASACALCAFDDIIVVGKMGEVFPDRIDHWVSFHVDLFDRWAAARALAGLVPAAAYWGAYFKGHRLGVNKKGVVATRQQPLNHARSVGGSSGFLAVQVAQDELRADQIVLAGVPMTAEAAHAAECSTPKEVESGLWGEADTYWATWLEHEDKLRGCVKSMSGRTRELLGAPTREWLGA